MTCLRGWLTACRSAASRFRWRLETPLVVTLQVMLVPELDVTDLAVSLRFYSGVLEFRVLFERAAERFAYLERDGVELMLQEAAGPGRRFRTAPLDHPFGRGINFQLGVDDVDALHARAVAAGADIVLPMEQRWYRVDVAEPGGRWKHRGPTEAGNRQFVLADPDGYLWRPFRDLGVRPDVTSA